MKRSEMKQYKNWMNYVESNLDRLSVNRSGKYGVSLNRNQNDFEVTYVLLLTCTFTVPTAGHKYSLFSVVGLHVFPNSKVQKQ